MLGNLQEISKKITAVFLLIVTAILLTGCTSGGDNNQGSGGGGDQANQEVTLQWWGVFWDKDVVQPLINQYQEENPNIIIEYVNKWPEGSRRQAASIYQDDLNRILKENNPNQIPDIFMVNNNWVGNYEIYTQPAPQSIVGPDTIDRSFYPAVSEDFVSEGSVRGLPIWMDTLAVIYNRDMLDDIGLTSPPRDWVEFKNRAQELTKRSGSTIEQAGFAAGTGNNVGFASEIFNLLLLQNGVQIVDSQGNPVFATDSDAKGALDFYKSFAGTNGTWSENMKNDSVAFLEGDLAMLIAPSWRYHEIVKFNELYDLGLDIGTAPVPQLAGQPEPNISWATYWGNMVAKNRPHSEEAWKFLSWITQPEQLRNLHQQDKQTREYFGFLYPRSNMSSILNRDTYVRTYNSSLRRAKTWPMVDGLAVQQVFTELLAGNSSSEALTSTQVDIQEIINNKGKL